MFGLKNKSNRELLQWMGQKAQYTPDISKLEESQFQLLFVCDDMMLGAKAYGLIKDNSANMARAFTRHNFNFYYSREHRAAIPIMGKRTSAYIPLRIKGEVHAVESSHFTKLDTRYKNGVLFNRVRVPLIIPYREHTLIRNSSDDGRELPIALQGNKHILGPEQLCTLLAHMYIGSSAHWSPKIDAGYDFPLVPTYEPKLSKPWLTSYYKFPKDERYFEDN